MFLKALRELGLSRKDIAEAIGVSVSTVGRWERGECNPRRDNYLKLQSFAVRELVSGLPISKASSLLGIPRTTLARHLRGEVVCRDPERYAASPRLLESVLGEDYIYLINLDAVPPKLRRDLYTTATELPDAVVRFTMYNLSEYIVDLGEAAHYLIETWMSREGISPDDETRVKRLVHGLVGEDGEGGILGWAKAVGGDEYVAVILTTFALADSLKEAWKNIRELYSVLGG